MMRLMIILSLIFFSGCAVDDFAESDRTVWTNQPGWLNVWGGRQYQIYMTGISGSAMHFCNIPSTVRAIVTARDGSGSIETYIIPTPNGLIESPDIGWSNNQNVVSFYLTEEFCLEGTNIFRAHNLSLCSEPGLACWIEYAVQWYGTYKFETDSYYHQGGAPIVSVVK
jgi:hypothetical protein